MDWIIVWTAIVATQAAGLGAAQLLLKLVLKAAVPSASRSLGDGTRLIYTSTSDDSA